MNATCRNEWVELLRDWEPWLRFFAVWWPLVLVPGRWGKKS